MKWIEIITVRWIAKTKRKDVDELLRQIGNQKEFALPLCIKLYHRFNLEYDLSIHMYWDIEGRNPSESYLGQQLACALKELGMLHHSIWIESENNW